VRRLRLEFDQLAPKVTWWCVDPTEHRGEILFAIAGGTVHYLTNGKVRPLSEIVMVLTSCLTGKA